MVLLMILLIADRPRGQQLPLFVSVRNGFDVIVILIPHFQERLVGIQVQKNCLRQRRIGIRQFGLLSRRAWTINRRYSIDCFLRGLNTRESVLLFRRQNISPTVVFPFLESTPLKLIDERSGAFFFLVSLDDFESSL